MKKDAAKTLASVLGPVTSPAHQKIVTALDERRRFFIDQNKERWTDTVRWWKLFYAKMDDPRKDEQDAWRSNTFTPLPFIVSNTKAATIHDLMTSIDPMIQAEGVGDEDVEPARGVEGLLAYQLLKTNYRRWLAGVLTRVSVQGTEFYKTVFKNQTHWVTHYLSKQELESFEKALTEAFMVLGIESPNGGEWPAQVPHYKEDPEAFETWRLTVNKAGKARIPELPSGGRKELIRYRGPAIERLNLYDVYADPLVDEIQSQTLVMHRTMQTPDWVKKQVKAGFLDGKAVDACEGGPDDTKTTESEHEINEMLGIHSGKDTDPYYDKAVEILECWQPSESDAPYTLIMNGKGIVNTDLELPYEHGEYAIGVVRNLWIPGYLHGIGDLQEPESMFKEFNVMRNLRVDRTYLETFPFFTFMDMSLPPLKRRLRPGDMIRAQRQHAIEPVVKYQATNAFQDMDMLWNQIAEAATAYSHIRGAPTDVNRVSATESEGRRQQALTRIKIQAVGIEDEFQQYAMQSVFLWYQKGDPELRVKTIGSQHRDPFLSIDKGQLFQALGMDFRFRGATKAVARDIQVSQLMQYLKDNAEMLIPPEVRYAMRVVAELLGVKGIKHLVSETGDQHYRDLFTTAKKQMELANKQQADQAAGADVSVPGAVPPEVATDLEREVGSGAGQPAGSVPPA